MLSRGPGFCLVPTNAIAIKTINTNGLLYNTSENRATNFSKRKLQLFSESITLKLQKLRKAFPVP